MKQITAIITTVHFSEQETTHAKTVFGAKQRDILISSCLHSKQNENIVIKSVLGVFMTFTNYRFSISFFLSVERFNLALPPQYKQVNRLRSATLDTDCAVLHDVVGLTKTSTDKEYG